ncbi:PaaI family thioesterase [Acidiphilium sp.]|uniref:PaaI family thioesterase n=1 Tax=Acidiphilium sp. TaxID=527 RepID=UPI00258E0F14|nr:PaaI family thioesterase [Acidiphilium sp.]
MSDDIDARLRAIPFFRFLGLSDVRLGEGTAAAGTAFADRFIGNPVANTYHGGIIASLLEAVASLTVWPDLAGPAPKPINLTVDYLRPALSEALVIRAQISRKGRRMASVESVAWQSDPGKPVAKGLFHFLLV